MCLYGRTHRKGGVTTRLEIPQDVIDEIVYNEEGDFYTFRGKESDMLSKITEDILDDMESQIEALKQPTFNNYKHEN